MSDQRFARLAYDPRFKRPKKDASKITIDSRFSHMLDTGEFQSPVSVDKYGRKMTKKSDDLRKFYKLDEGYARGEGLLESSTEEEEGDDSDLETSNLNEESIESEEEIPTGEETRRLACVNLDWDHIQAKDLFKVMHGITPGIKQVSIYLSEFGKERLKMEDQYGPFYDKKSCKEKEASEDDENEEGEFQESILRHYQLSRLKYYYAIIETDSIATAKYLYETCDGTEFESSGNRFDLRYVPDAMEFDEPVDTQKEAPIIYEPKEFVTNALQHSKVELTWDDDKDDRKVLYSKFNKKELQDMDFKAYLASEGSSDEESLQKYKDLLQPDEESDQGQDMEITFISGLSEKAKTLLDKKKSLEAQKEESVFEQMKRKQREKKKSKRKEEEESFFQEPEVETKRSKKLREKKEREELSLLMDHEESRHFDQKSILKKEKMHKRKKVVLGETQEDFVLDTSDPRFEAIQSDYHYAIDPTNPQFKKTKNMMKLLNDHRSVQ